MGAYLNRLLSCDACGFDLPVITDEQDCTDYRLRDSQVCDLIIVPLGAADPFDWSGANPVYVFESIKNETAGTGYAKRLVGEGGVPVPEKGIVQLPRNRQHVARRLFTLTFQVKNLEGGQYEFIKRFQCNWRLFNFYFLTTGGRLFGVQGGFVPLFVDADFPLDPTRAAKEGAFLTIQWESDGDAPRWNTTLNDSDIIGDIEPGLIPDVMGDPDTGEVWGDPGSGEVWGWL